MYVNVGGRLTRVDMAVPAKVGENNNQNGVFSSPDGQVYLVTIPQTAVPGQQFQVIVKGRSLTLTCPVGSGPGDMLRVAPMSKKTISLPTGRLGVYFKGKKRARVSRLEPFAQLRDVLQPDMIVDSLEIPGDGKYEDLNATRLGELLAITSDVPNRKIVVKTTITEGNSCANESVVATGLD